MKLNHTLTIFIVLLAFGSLKAQLTAKVTNAGTGYLELLPPDYDANPTKKYPLMIFLHGKGERGSGTPADLERVKRHGPPLEASRGHNMCFNVNGVEECFILIAPQLSGTRNNWGTNAIDPIFDFVLNESDYRVDLNRVYLTGLSLGGGGVYRYAPSDANFPNQIAAISAIAGWGRTSEGCIISERNMAMWSFHGDNDRTVGFGSGVAMYNAVNNCTTPVPTAEVRFTVYEGVGHNSWSRAYRTDNSLHTPNLYEWLLSKSLGGNPTANAGPDQDITLPTNSLTLNGTGSDPDGSIASYVWVKSSGPAATLTNQNTQDLSLSNLVEGVYNFTLTVTDNDGNTGSDQVEVVVNPEVVNLPPGVNAGQDFALTLPTNSTNITASATDSDGSIASYEWTQRSGPSTATLSGTTLPTVSISALVEGTYRFRVTVTDDDGASAFDNIDVTVNPEAANMSPVANAGSNISINLPTNSATLSGSGSDGDGSVTTYLWEKISGPTATLTNQNTPTLSVSNLVEGIYNFRLTVTDDDGDTGSDNATVTVVNTNQNPTANAGGDIIITLPTNTTTLNGGGSDPDGSISAYQWTQLNGPGTANIASPTNPITSISNLVEGVYQIELVVTDDDGASDTDVISVTVNAATVNTPPIADAGSDISITLPTNTVVINGSGTDADGTIVSYFWQRLSGPSSFMLTNENTASVHCF